LDVAHTLRGECAWDEQGKGRKPKTWMCFDVCTHCIGANIVILNWQRPLWE
jgi:hypothetical protein